MCAQAQLAKERLDARRNIPSLQVPSSSGQKGGAWPAAPASPLALTSSAMKAPRPSLPSAATQALHEELAAKDLAAAKLAKKKAKEYQEAAWRGNLAGQQEPSRSSASKDGKKSAHSTSGGSSRKGDGSSSRRSRSGQGRHDDEEGEGGDCHSRARSSGNRRGRHASEDGSESQRSRSKGKGQQQRRRSSSKGGDYNDANSDGGGSERGRRRRDGRSASGSRRAHSSSGGGRAPLRRDPLAHPRSASGIQLADDLFDSSSDEEHHQEWRGGRSNQPPRKDGRCPLLAFLLLLFCSRYCSSLFSQAAFTSVAR